MYEPSESALLPMRLAAKERALGTSVAIHRQLVASGQIFSPLHAFKIGAVASKKTAVP
jgi:hypothetical protein